MGSSVPWFAKKKNVKISVKYLSDVRLAKFPSLITCKFSFSFAPYKKIVLACKKGVFF